MSPDRRGRPLKPAGTGKRPTVEQFLPSSDDPHEPVYFQRADGSVPGRDFLEQVPPKVAATMKATLIAVAKAPPKRFAGGGYWEAMHGDMTGWYEVRVDGPKKQIHYRLFCRLDYEAQGRARPLLVVITGMSKAVRTLFSDADYAAVRDLGREYFSVNPRSIAES